MAAILHNLAPPWLPMAKNNRSARTRYTKIKKSNAPDGTDTIVALKKGKSPISSDLNDSYIDSVAKRSTVISGSNESLTSKVEGPLFLVEKQESVGNIKTSDGGIVPFAWLDIFDDSLPEVLKTYFNADLLSDSNENIHRLQIPEISDAVCVPIEILLPDGSYHLTNRRNLNIEIDYVFLDFLKNHLAEVGVNFAQNNLVFGAYKNRFNGIKYERIFLIVSKESKLPQFLIANNTLEISFELASALDGVEIMYRFMDESGELHYYCLGKIKNGNSNIDGDVLIQLR